MADDLKRVWTIRELMKSAIDHLLKKGIDNARLTVELLLSHALNLQRIQLYINFDKPLSHDEVSTFRQFYERRLSGEPVQYIIGSTSFMGLQFKVDRRVFIPRPETESLLEQAIVFGREYGTEKELEVFDIGTGSGNIAISIAKFLKHARITAIDVSASALEVARQNAELHSVETRIEFSQMDVFDLSEDIVQGKYDLIVDINRNGRYDEGVDALDGYDVSGSAGFIIPELSNYAVMILLVLATSFILIEAKSKANLSKIAKKGTDKTCV